MERSVCFFRRVEAGEKPSKKSKKGGAKKISCIIEGDSHPRKSFPHEPGTLGTKHDVKYSKGTWRQTKNRERMGSSRGIIQKYAKKDVPAEQRGIWPKNIYKLKYSDKATFYVLIEAKEMLAPTSKRPEEREFVVDSVAVMHMMIKKRIKLRGIRHFAKVQKHLLWYSLQTVKCTPTRKHKFSFTIKSIRDCNYSRKRLQSYRLGSFANATDTLMSGSRATTDQKWEEYNLQDRHFCTSCRSSIVHQFWMQFVGNIDTAGCVVDKSSSRAK